jgi:5'-nucleotidase (lipoprotein e(P4) family)
MSKDNTPLTDRRRRQLLAFLLASGATAPIASKVLAADADNGLSNSLLWALAWKQTAAEYFALCYQAYNLAGMLLDQELSQTYQTPVRRAVITDMDDTIIHAGSYWGHLVNENREFFDDAIWDEWLPNNLITPVPGSLDFFNYCKQHDVEVFYVTSRNQGDRTYEYALAQLQLFDFPYADEEHLSVFRDTSDKSSAREKIAETHVVPFLLGDNLNDYKRDYYVKDVDERLQLMHRDKAEFGTKFVLLPNPTDGHWVRAIFGDSEPAESDENRRLLKEAATRNAWEGR